MLPSINFGSVKITNKVIVSVSRKNAQIPCTCNEILICVWEDAFTTKYLYKKQLFIVDRNLSLLSSINIKYIPHWMPEKLVLYIFSHSCAPFESFLFYVYGIDTMRIK